MIIALVSKMVKLEEKLKALREEYEGNNDKHKENSISYQSNENGEGIKPRGFVTGIRLLLLLGIIALPLCCGYTCVSCCTASWNNWDKGFRPPAQSYVFQKPPQASPSANSETKKEVYKKKQPKQEGCYLRNSYPNDLMIICP